MTESHRRRLSDLSDIADLLEHFLMKGIRLDSQLGLLGFLSGNYQLELVFRVPTPAEMLELQCEGRRFLTLIDNLACKSFDLGRHKTPFEFFLHDLEHAHKFFGNPEQYGGQVLFFKFLRASLAEFEVFSGDAKFRADLNYLMSDMNTHPMHLFKFLKAVVCSAEMRRTQLNQVDLTHFWSALLGQKWKMSGKVLDAARRINQPDQETEVDRVLVSRHFQQRFEPSL